MKTRCIGLILICVMMLVGGIACKSSNLAPNGMTGAQILDLSNEAILDTFQFDVVMEIGVMGEYVTAEMEGACDNLDREAYIITTSTQVPEMNTAFYILDDWLYMEISESEWIRTALTDDLWEQQDLPTQQLDLLQEFVEVRYLATEVINDIECYKLEVQPDMEALWNWADMGELDATIDLDEFFSEFSIFAWVAEDNYVPVQLYYDVVMQMDFLGDKLTMVLSLTMTMSHHNESVDIELPAGALDAEEITYEEFMYGTY